ncbi:hypothetical protein BT63DRAFT_296556 [Microthyrium microscopicum]|uniref:Azaphilone pigments biosynthesis cluster protein L N-terminal domain-containing protein n=1 Tax=Microthyrium microscopicum TaxID=703497 RepID=A0A6A6U8J8_9PEZI|nr:hypothetical protein BT63DRAFT_296556 [Microthyrium microscopicum]
MDPLSITAGCIGLLEFAAKCIPATMKLVREFREAREQLTALQEQMETLRRVVDLIKYECEGMGDTIITMKSSVPALTSDALENCKSIMEQMSNTISKHGSSHTAFATWWVGIGKEEVEKWSRKLEQHKSTLVIALEYIEISISKQTKADTTILRSDTTVIKTELRENHQATKEILALIKAQHPELPTDLKELNLDDGLDEEKVLEQIDSYADKAVEAQYGSKRALKKENSGTSTPPREHTALFAKELDSAFSVSTKQLSPTIAYYTAGYEAQIKPFELQLLQV